MSVQILIPLAIDRICRQLAALLGVVPSICKNLYEALPLLLRWRLSEDGRPRRTIRLHPENVKLGKVVTFTIKEDGQQVYQSLDTGIKARVWEKKLLSFVSPHVVMDLITI